MLIGIRPQDEAYYGSDGVVYHPQDENNTGNIPFYEITDTADSIEFDLTGHLGGLDTPIAVLHTAFGTTDFDLRDRETDDAIISEQSGFDQDTWIVDLSGTSGRYELTQFDTTNGVDGTQAGWQAYITLLGAET